MLKLDEQEVKITRELIKNPRSSDNAISRLTGIPVMSVNRKRKKLEEKGILNYYVDVKAFESGINVFHARQLYIVQLRSGITREEYVDYLKKSAQIKEVDSSYVEESFIGEQSGRLAIIMVLEAKTESELVEVFNGKIVKEIKERFGQNSITNISTARINVPVRKFHNYLPFINMEHGKIKKDWPDDYIFVNKPKKVVKTDEEIEEGG